MVEQHRYSERRWRRYVLTFLAVFVSGLAGIFGFVLLLDPFGISPVALPVKPSLVTTQRYMYPQIIRSRKFDSIIVGTSTTMLIDPQQLTAPFGASFANLAMASATAWEQTAVIDLFLREVKNPKVVVVGLDVVWCDAEADRNRITSRGFPDWLYDDTRWNDFVHLLNRLTLASALRRLRAHFGLFVSDMRPDGMQKFLPDESEYDRTRAQQKIDSAVPAVADTEEAPRRLPPANVPVDKSQTPALAWLEDALSRLPASTVKILAFMPVHVSAQGHLGECKERIVGLAQRRGAAVVDWRIASAITREDSNYWDGLHYRVPIAERIARELPEAILSGRASADETYQVLAR